MTKDMCEVICIHEAKVNRAKKDLAKQNPMGVAKVWKPQSDDTRVKIAYGLSAAGELCVCDVANIIEASPATASHHVRRVNSLVIATYRQAGKLVYYSLDDEHVKQLVEKAFEHQKEAMKVG